MSRSRQRARYESFELFSDSPSTFTLMGDFDSTTSSRSCA
jgi:hypothetical protein